MFFGEILLTFISHYYYEIPNDEENQDSPVRRKKKKKWEETDLIPIVQIPEVKRKKVTEDDRIQELEAHFAAKYGKRKASSNKKHMTNIDLACCEVSKLAGVPNSKGDLEKWMRHQTNAPSKKYSYSKRKELAAAMQLRWNAFKRTKTWRPLFICGTLSPH